MTINVYQMVTDRIIAKLEQGVIPWRKPWIVKDGIIQNVAVNYVTQKPYSGVNAWLLDNGEYATFKQIQDAGGKVKKGAKSEIIVYWQMLEKKTQGKDGKEKVEKIPLLKYYNVFNIETCTDLEPKRKPITVEPTKPTEIIELAEQLIQAYADKPLVKHLAGDSAHYKPSIDELVMPKQEQFTNIEEYYSTFFHELVHSTGHDKRLNRNLLGSFGTENYAKEELVAEMGASMLCAFSNIVDRTIDNSASYIQSWLRKLKNDNKMVISASSQAEKAVNYIKGAC